MKKLFALGMLALSVEAVYSSTNNACDYRPFDQKTKKVLECSYTNVPMELPKTSGAVLEEGSLCVFELPNGRTILATKRFVIDPILSQRVVDKTFSYNSSTHETTLMFEASEKDEDANGSFTLTQKASSVVTPFGGSKFWSMMFDYDSTTDKATLIRKHFPRGRFAGTDRQEVFDLDCR